MSGTNQGQPNTGPAKPPNVEDHQGSTQIRRGPTSGRVLVKGSQPDKAIGSKARVSGRSGNGQTSHAYSQFDPRRDSRNDGNIDEPDMLVDEAEHEIHDQRGQSTEAQPDTTMGGEAEVSGRSGNEQISKAHSQFDLRGSSHSDRDADMPDVLGAQHGAQTAEKRKR